MSVYVLFEPFSSGAMSLLSIKKKKKKAEVSMIVSTFCFKTNYYNL